MANKPIDNLVHLIYTSTYPLWQVVQIIVHFMNANKISPIPTDR